MDGIASLLAARLKVLFGQLNILFLFDTSVHENNFDELESHVDVHATYMYGNVMYPNVWQAI